VGLEAESPLGVLEAVAHGELRVALQVGPVHRLKVEPAEPRALELGGVESVLWKDQLLSFRTGNPGSET